MNEQVPYYVCWQYVGIEQQGEIEKEQAHNARIIWNLYNWNWAWIYGEIIFIHHMIILDVYTNFEHLFEATKWSSIVGFKHRYELRIFDKVYISTILQIYRESK